MTVLGEFSTEDPQRVHQMYLYEVTSGDKQGTESERTALAQRMTPDTLAGSPESRRIVL